MVCVICTFFQFDTVSTSFTIKTTHLLLLTWNSLESLLGCPVQLPVLNFCSWEGRPSWTAPKRHVFRKSVRWKPWIIGVILCHSSFVSINSRTFFKFDNQPAGGWKKITCTPVPGASSVPPRVSRCTLGAENLAHAHVTRDTHLPEKCFVFRQQDRVCAFSELSRCARVVFKWSEQGLLTCEGPGFEQGKSRLHCSSHGRQCLPFGNDGTDMEKLYRFPGPFSCFLQKTGLGNVKISFANFFYNWNVMIKGKAREKRKNTARFMVSLGASAQTVIGRTVFMPVRVSKNCHLGSYFSGDGSHLASKSL